MRKENLKIILIVLLGFILRLVNLNQSFWLDEAAQVMESVRPLSQQLKIISDFHPPLYHLLLHFWMYFDTSEIWVRLPSVLLGTGCVYLLYRLAHRLGNERIGLFSALFLALSPYHIWYSQEARPYMLFIFLSLASTLMLVEKKWVLYTFTAILCLYSLYFAPFLLIGHLVYIYLFEKKYLQNILGSLFIAGIFFLPWIPSFTRQLDRGTSGIFSGWANVVSVVPIKAVPLTFAKFILGKGTIDDLLIYGLAVLPVFVLFIINVWKSWKRREGKIIIILFFVPFLTSLIISFFIPILAPQRLIFLLPIFLMIIAYGVFHIEKIWRTTAIIVVIVTSLFGLFDYYSNPYVQREQWRQAVSYVEGDGGDNSLVIFVFPEPFAPYLWYREGKVEALGIASRFRVENNDLERLAVSLNNKEKIYLFQYLTGLTDPTDLTRTYIESLGYRQSTVKDFPGVGFIYLFEKTI